MTHKTVFRLLAVLSLVAAIASGMMAAYPGDISGDWKTVLEWHGDGSYLSPVLDSTFAGGGGQLALLGLALVLGLFAVATQIGIFLFWRFARPSYAVLTAFLILFTLFSGLSVMTPTEAALFELSLLLDGAVLAMSYLSPIKAHFQKELAR